MAITSATFQVICARSPCWRNSPFTLSRLPLSPDGRSPPPAAARAGGPPLVEALAHVPGMPLSFAAPCRSRRVPGRNRRLAEAQSSASATGCWRRRDKLPRPIQRLVLQLTVCGGVKRPLSPRRRAPAASAGLLKKNWRLARRRRPSPRHDRHSCDRRSERGGRAATSSRRPARQLAVQAEDVVMSGP